MGEAQVARDGTVQELRDLKVRREDVYQHFLPLAARAIQEER